MINKKLWNISKLVTINLNLIVVRRKHFLTILLDKNKFINEKFNKLKFLAS